MRLLMALEKLRRTHYQCEDCWYSCPKAGEEYCGDRERDGDACNCGADEHNMILDSIITHLKSVGL